MTKNLNQAFIKAYSKNRANQAAKLAATKAAADKPAAAIPSPAGLPPTGLQGYSTDDFIVRFDTATCPVPQHHLNVNHKPKVAAAALKRKAPPVQRAPLHSQPPLDRNVAATQQAHATELRTAIAQQMSRAGQWDDDLSIDPLDHNFPMISAYHHRPSATPWNQDSTRRTIVSQERDSHSAGQPARTQSKGNAPELPSLQAPSLLNDWQPEASSELLGRDVGDESSGSEKRSGHDSESRATMGHERKATSEGFNVTPATEAGEFFRLDRPSYMPSAIPGGDAQLSDSAELSSEMLEFSTSATNIDIARLQSRPPHGDRADSDGLDSDGADNEVDTADHISHLAPKTTARAVHAVEAELRRAKLRIFNPVWEVDSFQWPDICLELLEQRAESMQLVAQNLIEAVHEGLQVLAVTSPHGGEGRTTVACCLAKLAGSRGLNVAIVDGDIENPTLSYQTNLDVEQDWKTAILNQLPIEEVAVHSIDDQVTLVPLIDPIEQAELATDDNRIEFMLHELSESFDLVIVDMGHMNSPRSLVASLGARGVISAVVAVVDRRNSDPQQLAHCLRRIRQTGIASIGVVENFAA